MDTAVEVTRDTAGATLLRFTEEVERSPATADALWESCVAHLGRQPSYEETRSLMTLLLRSMHDREELIAGVLELARQTGEEDWVKERGGWMRVVTSDEVFSMANDVAERVQQRDRTTAPLKKCVAFWGAERTDAILDSGGGLGLERGTVSSNLARALGKAATVSSRLHTQKEGRYALFARHVCTAVLDRRAAYQRGESCYGFREEDHATTTDIRKATVAMEEEEEKGGPAPTGLTRSALATVGFGVHPQTSLPMKLNAPVDRGFTTHTGDDLPAPLQAPSTRRDAELAPTAFTNTTHQAATGGGATTTPIVASSETALREVASNDVGQSTALVLRQSDRQQRQLQLQPAPGTTAKRRSPSNAPKTNREPKAKRQKAKRLQQTHGSTGEPENGAVTEPTTAMVTTTTPVATTPRCECGSLVGPEVKAHLNSPAQPSASDLTCFLQLVRGAVLGCDGETALCARHHELAFVKAGLLRCEGDAQEERRRLRAVCEEARDEAKRRHGRYREWFRPEWGEPTHAGATGLLRYTPQGRRDSFWLDEATFERFRTEWLTKDGHDGAMRASTWREYGVAVSTDTLARLGERWTHRLAKGEMEFRSVHELAREEMEVYRHHERRVEWGPELAWLHGMWRGLTVQYLWQNPYVYLDHVCLNPSRRHWLVAIPHMALDRRPGDGVPSSSFVRTDLAQRKDRSAEAALEPEACVLLEDEACAPTEFAPGLHHKIAQFLDGRADSPSPREIEAWADAQLAQAGAEWTQVGCRALTIRFRASGLPYRVCADSGQGPVRHVYPRLSGLSDDHERLCLVDCTWDQIAAAHSCSTAEWPGHGAQDFPLDVPAGRHPLTIPLAADNPIAEAITTRRRWDDPLVVQYARSLFTNSQQRRMEEVRRWDQDLLWRLHGCYNRFKEAEMALFGPDSYWRVGGTECSSAASQADRGGGEGAVGRQEWADDGVPGPRD